MGKLQIYELTKPELDNLINLCNFTADELEYFNARAKGKSHVMIGIECHLSDSKVNALSRAVRRINKQAYCFTQYAIFVNKLSLLV